MHYRPGTTFFDGERLTVWDHEFTWSAHHLSHQQYSVLKQTYDTVAADALAILETLPDPPHAEKNDLYARLKAHRSSHPALAALWEQTTTIPEWVDWAQIARGQDVFYRYGLATLAGLAYQSLLGGTGGSGQISETLSRTGGFSIASVRRRLLETTQFTLQVTESEAALHPGGTGAQTALRVRLLHARVRRRILQLAEKHPAYYSTAKFGVPINDADCISTIVAFGPMVIWSALPRQGLYVSNQEAEDYIALWRLVAYYMGTPTDYFASPARAKAAMETALLYEYTPTPTSKTLARNIIRALENQAPDYPSRALIEVHTRWLNGDALADALDLPRPTAYYRALAAGQVLLFAVSYKLMRKIPFVDRWHIRAMKRDTWDAIMAAKNDGLKKLTVFDFKYIPSLEKGGDALEADVAEKKKDVFWTADMKALVMLLVPLPWIAVMLWASTRVARAVLEM